MIMMIIMMFILDYHLCDEAEVGSCEGRSDFPLPGGFWRKVFRHIFEYSMTKSNITSDIRIFHDQFEDSIASPPYLIFVIFFTQAKFLENKIYIENFCQFLPIYTEICTEKRQFLPIFANFSRYI